MVVTHGSLQRARGRCALTIGNFDGVHRGHRALIHRAVSRAGELGVSSCVLTFEPHPREFFAGDSAGARLTRLRDKLELIETAGADRVHVARFDRRFASLSAQRFIDEVLVQGLATRWLLVGRDFRFGAGRQGDYTTLEQAGRQHGFEVESMPDVLFEGSRVSSSAVRGLLRAGDLGGAERLLGHPYTLSGRVVHGAKLGRSLGFPTANIVLRRAPPLSGIFVVEASGAPGGVRTGVASIGRRPTVNPVPVPLLEVHLFGWQGELYGQHLRVRIMKKLRDEEKYADLAALKAAIARDAQEAREYLANHG